VADADAAVDDADARVAGAAAEVAHALFERDVVCEALGGELDVADRAEAAMEAEQGGPLGGLGDGGGGVQLPAALRQQAATSLSISLLLTPHSSGYTAGGAALPQQLRGRMHGVRCVP
jgi:hypothetical protein